MSPQIKIITYLLFIISLFFVRDLTVYLLVFIPFFLLLIKVPCKTLKSGWIPISLLLTFTFISNMFYQQGRILFNSNLFVVTQEGIQTALLRTMRVFFMIAGAKIVIAYTKVELLTGALRKILQPLERLKVPVDDFFQVMELTMKSLPVLKEQTVRMYQDKVDKEQRKGYLERVRTVSSLLIPMFVKSIQAPDKFFPENGQDETISASSEKRKQ
jgi:energy-coupling factor transport system permease protein